MDAAQKPRGNGEGQQAAGVRYGTSPGRRPPRSKAAAQTTPLMRIVPAFRASGGVLRRFSGKTRTQNKDGASRLDSPGAATGPRKPCRDGESLRPGSRCRRISARVWTDLEEGRSRPARRSCLAALGELARRHECAHSPHAPPCEHGGAQACQGPGASPPARPAWPPRRSPDARLPHRKRGLGAPAPVPRKLGLDGPERGFPPRKVPVTLARAASRVRR